MLTNLICTVTIPTDYSFKHCGLWCKQIHKYYRSVLVFFLSHQICVFFWLDLKLWTWPRFQAMLQELGKQNPQLLRLIQDHQAEFLQLINEPLEGFEGQVFSPICGQCFFICLLKFMWPIQIFVFFQGSVWPAWSRHASCYQCHTSWAASNWTSKLSSLIYFPVWATIINLFTIFSLLRAFVAGSNGVW